MKDGIDLLYLTYMHYAYRRVTGGNRGQTVIDDTDGWYSSFMHFIMSRGEIVSSLS